MPASNRQTPAKLASVLEKANISDPFRRRPPPFSPNLWKNTPGTTHLIKTVTHRGCYLFFRGRGAFDRVRPRRLCWGGPRETVRIKSTVGARSSWPPAGWTATIRTRSGWARRRTARVWRPTRHWFRSSNCQWSGPNASRGISPSTHRNPAGEPRPRKPSDSPPRPRVPPLSAGAGDGEP